MHARPAMMFVETASRFNANVRVRRADNGDEVFDGKSIMQVMMLAATQGTALVIEAEGDDADAALQELAELIKGGFNEE
ncbi:MAG: HPr family phosphocarrier protein [Phycisphaeraceae bacterium]|nr:HPr family phosphocarrier protein [Phycisphaerales bacterium]QOJ17490.1 MAG: HPr family phosphocarrier protein [Phycisphaeraceae bacterium]